MDRVGARKPGSTGHNGALHWSSTLHSHCVSLTGLELTTDNDCKIDPLVYVACQQLALTLCFVGR